MPGVPVGLLGPTRVWTTSVYLRNECTLPYFDETERMVWVEGGCSGRELMMRRPDMLRAQVDKSAKNALMDTGRVSTWALDPERALNWTTVNLLYGNVAEIEDADVEEVHGSETWLVGVPVKQIT